MHIARLQFLRLGRFRACAGAFFSRIFLLCMAAPDLLRALHFFGFLWGFGLGGLCCCVDFARLHEFTLRIVVFFGSFVVAFALYFAVFAYLAVLGHRWSPLGMGRATAPRLRMYRCKSYAEARKGDARQPRAMGSRRGHCGRTTLQSLIASTSMLILTSSATAGMP